MVTLPIRSIVYILDENQWIVVSKMFLSHIITLIIVNFLSAKQFNCESSIDSNTSTHNLINFLKSIDTISKFINNKQKETIRKLCKMKTVSSLRWKCKFSNTMKFFLFFFLWKGSIVRVLWLQIGKVHGHNNRWIHFDDFPLLRTDYTKAACFVGSWANRIVGYMGHESWQEIFGYRKEHTFPPFLSLS